MRADAADAGQPMAEPRRLEQPQSRINSATSAADVGPEARLRPKVESHSVPYQAKRWFGTHFRRLSLFAATREWIRKIV